MEEFRFSNFVLRRRERRLICASKDILIGSRAFDLLELLVACHDRVVSRDAVMEAVWPGTVVGDNNLNVQVGNLRRLLGADAIMTVAGRGLRFALDVRPGNPVPPEMNPNCAATLAWLGLYEAINGKAARGRAAGRGGPLAQPARPRTRVDALRVGVCAVLVARLSGRSEDGRSRA